MKESKHIWIWWLILATALFPQMTSMVYATGRSFITVAHLPCSPYPALRSGLSPQAEAATSSMAEEVQPQDAKDSKHKASKIGSSPPSCDGKCYGCSPCEPIQVPSITSRVGLQYANYEPEGWKCKCGPLFYSP